MLMIWKGKWILKFFELRTLQFFHKINSPFKSTEQLDLHKLKLNNFSDRDKDSSCLGFWMPPMSTPKHYTLLIGLLYLAKCEWRKRRKEKLFEKEQNVTETFRMKLDLELENWTNITGNVTISGKIDRLVISIMKISSK